MRALPKRIRTAQLIVSFIFAKLMSLVAAFALLGVRGDTEAIELMSHVLSVLLFFSLVLFLARCSVPALISGTRVPGPRWGSAVAWGILAIPLGFLVRFGIEGAYFVTVNVYSHPAAVSDLNDLATKHSGGYGTTVLALIAGTLVGAFDEEVIYRRILLWHFVASYGVVAGLLITSALFGIIHMNPVAAAAGVCLACIYMASGRLWVAVVVHAAGNLFHPLAHPLIAGARWEVFLMASALAAAVLAAVMACCALKIRQRVQAYSRLRPTLSA